MARIAISFLLTTLIVLGVSFFTSCSKARHEEAPLVIGDIDAYTFTPDQQHLLSNAQHFPLSSGTALEEALARLAGHLANSYFRKTYTQKETNIRFEIVDINTIATPSRSLRIATVNMVDPDKDAVAYFFQGSAGARTTFYLLAATFLQPHLDPPLLDGLVLLYNGKILPELDHINLAGILTPRMVQHAAERAIDEGNR